MQTVKIPPADRRQRRPATRGVPQPDSQGAVHAPARSGDIQPAVPVEIGNGHIHINAGDGRGGARHPRPLAGAQPDLDAALEL